jgi:hypothetical protein
MSRGAGRGGAAARVAGVSQPRRSMARGHIMRAVDGSGACCIVRASERQHATACTQEALPH